MTEPVTPEPANLEAVSPEPAVTLALIIDASSIDEGSDSPQLRRTILSACVPETGNEWDEVLVVGAERLPAFLPTGIGELSPRPLLTDVWTSATAEHLVFLPAGCELVSDATNSLRDLVIHNRTVDVAYFDSTGYDRTDGQLVQPCHRPGFSPERLRAQMYLGQMLLIRRQLARSFDPTGELLQTPIAHSDASRLTATAASVAHLPQVLYRFPVPDGLTDPETAGERLAGHQRRLQEEGFPATAMIRPGAEAIIDLEPRLSDTPPVSIVIPTNGASRRIDGRSVVLCLQAVDSIIAKTSYVDYELVVVVTPGAPPDLAADVLAIIEARTGARQPTVRFCLDDRPFNFSNACNRGAVAAAGDVLVFLNDDTVVETRNWLDRLVMYAVRPDIGAVGARLLYGDGTIQHAGIWSRGGHPTHRYERFNADHAGYLNSLLVPQNCLAVTGACLAVTADKFREVGGFSPEFPSSYNDVDLCLKLDDFGYRTVVDPATVLTHFEASSRDPHIDDWERELLHERWRTVLTNDRFDNPHHLSLGSEEFPAPDPVVTECKRLAGWVDHLPRLWPSPQLTIDPTLVDHTQDNTPGGATNDSGGTSNNYVPAGR